jgi:NADH:quinone reductase (non-electrogenic)
MVIFPIVARTLKIPVIASGGIADGRGLAAALALGCEGINMGTRFVATREAPIHDNIKQMLVQKSERDTNVIFRTLHNSGRVMKNAVSDEVIAIEGRPGGCTFDDVRPLVVGARGRDALMRGDADGGLVWASQAMGLIDDIPSCADLLQTMMRDCRAALAQAQSGLAS